MLDTMPWASTSGCLFMDVLVILQGRAEDVWKDLVFFRLMLCFELIILEIDHLYYIIQLPGLEWSFPSCLSLKGLHNSLPLSSPRMSIETQLWIEHPPNPGAIRPPVPATDSHPSKPSHGQTPHSGHRQSSGGPGVDTFNLSQLSHHDPGRGAEERRGGHCWPVPHEATSDYACLTKGWVTGILIMKYNTLIYSFPSNRIPIRWL